MRREKLGTPAFNDYRVEDKGNKTSVKESCPNFTKIDTFSKNTIEEEKVMKKDK
jgi:hypothetical protein